MKNRWVVFILALVAVAQMFAQTTAGVNGVVTDSSGAMVPGATVIVTNLDTGATGKPQPTKTARISFRCFSRAATQ